MGHVQLCRGLPTPDVAAAVIDVCCLLVGGWFLFLISLYLWGRSITGSWMLFDSYHFSCISLTQPLKLYDSLFVSFFALQLERSAPIESAVQADLHSAMWIQFIQRNGNSQCRHDSNPMRGGFQIHLKKSWPHHDSHDRRVLYYLIWLPNDHESTV